MATSKSPSALLREMVAGPDPVMLPSVYDGITARIAEAAGAPAVEVSGSGAAAATAGLPDVGLVTMSEMLDNARGIIEAVDVPVVADLDDGGGTPLTVHRTFKNAERMGLAGGHLDDIATGIKFFTGYPRKIVSLEEGVDRVKAAVEARDGDDGIMIFSRTYATDHSEGIDRVCAYAEAGADVLFLVWSDDHDLSATTAAKEQMPRPLFRALTHAATTREQLIAAGVHVIGTIQPFLVILKTMEDVYGELMRDGDISNHTERCAPASYMKDAFRIDEATARAERFHMISK